MVIILFCSSGSLFLYLVMESALDNGKGRFFVHFNLEFPLPGTTSTLLFGVAEALDYF